ncbi:MAG TPA: NADPH:quinone oxidoreductase family protein [Candidatus Angelobacter sp.]|nr:NADPH:quinone oxidoreductase family protein [Candidatus Angelobacter sp.]
MVRAVQVVETTGPAGVRVNDLPEPVPAAGDVLVDVHAIGVSFPDLLLTRGQYQLRPDLPFTLGADCAGTVIGGDLEPGRRVAAFLPHGAAAERVAVPASWVFPLPDRLTFAQGAALPLNYLTAHFALAVRGQLRPGETVLVHGGAGGVGTACLQVARGLGARTIAVVSTEAKREVALTAGADHAVLLDGFREEAAAITSGSGSGVDVVVDVVGGDVVTDSLRSLAPFGRLLVVGFAAGQGIPEVKVNRLLLNNIDVRGVGWGAYALSRPGYPAEQWAQLLPMMDSGVIAPVVGATYGMADFAQALVDMDARRTLGKSVVLVRE